jgi:hypothetical protein
MNIIYLLSYYGAYDMVAIISVDKIYSHGWNYVIKMKLDYMMRLLNCIKLLGHR